MDGRSTARSLGGQRVGALAGAGAGFATRASVASGSPARTAPARSGAPRPTSRLACWSQRTGRRWRSGAVGGGPGVGRTAAATAPARIRGPGRAAPGPPLRHRPRPLRGRDRRAAGRRRRDVTGLDLVQPSAAVLHLRRHRPASVGRQRHRILARGRLVPRPARLERRLPEPLRQRPVTARPARGDVWRRLGRRRRHRRLLAGGDRSHRAERRTTTARCTTRGWSDRAGPRRDTTTPPGSRCAVGERDPATLVAPEGPPVRCTEEITPVAVLRTPSGATVLDFGQNLVGRLRIRVSGDAGDWVVIRTAEVLQEGEIYTRPLRSAQSTDEYILAGGRVEDWEPRFTFHGFRYAEVDRLARRPRGCRGRGDVVARVYHTDLERTGWFDVLGRPGQPAARERRVEHARQLPRHPHRLPAAGRAGRLDRRHPGVRAHRGVPLRRLRHALVLAAGRRGRAAARRDGALVRAGHPGARDVDADPPGRGLGRRGDAHARGTSTSGSATWRSWPRQYDSAQGVGGAGREAGRARRGCGTAASSSATGSTRPRRRRTRPTPAPTATWWPRPTSPAPRSAWRHGRGPGPRRRRRPRYAALAAEVRAAFADAVRAARRPDDQRRPDRIRAGDRLRPAVPAGAAAAAGAGWPSWSRSRSTGSPPASWAPRWSAMPSASTGHVDAAYRPAARGGGCPSWLYAVRQGATTIWERWDSLLPGRHGEPRRR